MPPCRKRPSRVLLDAFFRRFEAIWQPFGPPPGVAAPNGGIAFLRHFVRQRPSVFAAMLVLGGLTAFVEAALFVFVGVVVDMMTDTGPRAFLADHGATLLAMAVLVALVRPAIAVATALVEEQIVVPGFFTDVRWQSHRQVTGQDLSFFEDEMAGRISQKVWQAGQAAGDVMVSLLQLIWFIAVFAFTTVAVIGSLDWRLMVPVLAWLGIVATIARLVVPRIRDRGRAMAEASSLVTGRMVDGYTNVKLIKLHEARDTQDAFIRSGWDELLAVVRRFTRTISLMRFSFQTISSLMLVVIAAVALWLFTRGALTAGTVAVALALCLRLNLLLGRLLGLLNGLFRNFGTVQNSARLISTTPTVLDAPDAAVLADATGEVRFEGVTFGYTRGQRVLGPIDLVIRPGERVGIVGQSGVGKSTLLSLLLRFHDVDGGRILLDGTDIATVTQASLRRQFGLVAQEPALLQRSVRDNIAFGRPDATQAEIEEAARLADAHDFITGLADDRGRTGYDVLVGERGVKLSGGQRQRIAIARVLLQDAPILLLDEATSSLDSEVEAVIQENLARLVAGKTVIAIAHRLSTIASFDRLVVMEEGRIVEEGDHAALLSAGGLYARLWRRQTGSEPG